MQVQSSPIAIKSLQPELVRLVKRLHSDLRERCDEFQPAERDSPRETNGLAG
jgi:hypothetical protein